MYFEGNGGNPAKYHNFGRNGEHGFTSYSIYLQLYSEGSSQCRSQLLITLTPSNSKIYFVILREAIYSGCISIFEG